MAVIEGQIEPLKKLKDILRQNGITRFDSIGEINCFRKNYETEKNAIPETVQNELDAQINQLQIDLAKYRHDYEDLRGSVTREIDSEIKKFEIELGLMKEIRKQGFVHKIFYYLKTKTLTKKKAYLERNFENILKKKTYSAEVAVSGIREQFEYYTSNRDALISERSVQYSIELERTKDVIDSLYNLIAGAIGENSVVKEVQKLPNNYHLFNDFSVGFDPPIYNKKKDDRIYSIQIDHLLVSEAGIFILETKNWGKHSVDSIDLRSPVEQIMRANYALFVLLNSRSGHNINLESHHWGDKEIPVRNIIVMTNVRPREEFKHVKVLSLSELNAYITYFDPIFNDREVANICDHLRWMISPERYSSSFEGEG